MSKRSNPVSGDLVDVVTSSAIGAVTVTASDTLDLDLIPTAGLYVGVTGNVKVDMADGSTVTFNALAAGMIHKISCTRVYNTGTTATNIIALY